MFSLLHTKTLKLWKYDSITYGACVMLVVYDVRYRIWKALFFCPTTRKREAGVFKSPHSEDQFWTDASLVTQPDENITRFQTKKGTSRRGLRRSLITYHFGPHLTPFVLGVTNINFLTTISIHYQEETGWELIKLSLKGKCFDLLSNRPFYFLSFVFPF